MNSDLIFEDFAADRLAISEYEFIVGGIENTEFLFDEGNQSEESLSFDPTKQ